MDNEKMRAEFEDWYNKTTDHNGGVAYYTEMDGRYCYEDIEVLWKCWQASRAALVIDLPARLTEGDDYADGWNHALTLAGGAIGAAGVKVKP